VPASPPNDYADSDKCNKGRQMAALVVAAENLPPGKNSNARWQVKTQMT
jgi:hypothetical protein